MYRRRRVIRGVDVRLQLTPFLAPLSFVVIAGLPIPDLIKNAKFFMTYLHLYTQAAYPFQLSVSQISRFGCGTTP
jgi:hypothetical protein